MLNPGLAPWAMQEYRPYRARFGECVVKIGMGGIVCNYCVWLGALVESAFRLVIRSLRIKKTSPKYAVFQRA